MSDMHFILAAAVLMWIAVMAVARVTWLLASV